MKKRITDLYITHEVSDDIYTHMDKDEFTDLIHKKSTYELVEELIKNEFVETVTIDSPVKKTKKFITKITNDIDTPNSVTWNTNPFGNEFITEDIDVISHIRFLERDKKRAYTIIKMLWDLLPPSISGIPPTKHPLGVGWSLPIETSKSKELKQTLITKIKDIKWN